jgi:hypothetical protein
MKHVQLFEQFVNEKVYRMTGVYSSKGLVGKVMQAFKQEISKIKYEGDQKATLAEVNKTWSSFKSTGEKIILDAVEKGAKSMDSVLFVTANLDKGFHIDEINKLNREGSDELFVGYELVINVGFMDDVNGSKLYKKIDKTGMMNSPIASKKDTIYGTMASVGNNNLEIRDNEFMSIDSK